MNALIIIDMLNDFMHPQGALYIGDHVQSLIQFCKELIVQKRKEQYTRLSTQVFDLSGCKK